MARTVGLSVQSVISRFIAQLPNNGIVNICFVAMNVVPNGLAHSKAPMRPAGVAEQNRTAKYVARLSMCFPIALLRRVFVLVPVLTKRLANITVARIIIVGKVDGIGIMALIGMCSAEGLAGETRPVVFVVHPPKKQVENWMFIISKPFVNSVWNIIKKLMSFQI